MTQSLHSKYLYQRQLWQELELHLDNLHRVFLSTQTTHSTLYSLVIWPLDAMLLKGQVSELTQEELEDLVRRLEVVKSNIQELSLSLRSLRQQLEVAHKTVFEEVVQQSTFPIWHQEIEDILVLKNNKGTEDNRVRKLDYSIQLSELFYKRFLSNSEISLFSPHNVPGLYEAFGTPEFDELYERYERATSIPKTKVSARDLFTDLLKERAETGRIYIMNIDHCNSHSSFQDKINMSNLCQEITLPTDPIQHIDGKGEIALCILSCN